VTTFHPTNEAFMASVIDNNIVMWDVGQSGVKIVCTAVLDGKGEKLIVCFIWEIIFTLIILYIQQ
jgi:hypothetical protein